MVLDDAERARFLAWCEANAESNRAMLKQMEKLPGVVSGIETDMKRKTAALLIVAGMLSETEKQTIGG